MVVRYILRSVIHRLPYSDHLPSIIDTILSESATPTTTTNNTDTKVGSTTHDGLIPIPLSPPSPKQRIHSKLITNRSILNPVDEKDELEYDEQQQHLQSHHHNLESLQEVENEDEEELNEEDDEDDELTAVNYLNYVDTCETTPTYTNLGINKLSGNRSVLNNHSRRQTLQTNTITNNPQLLQPITSINDNGSNTLIDSANSSTISTSKQQQSSSKSNDHNQSVISTTTSNDDERDLRIKQYLNEQNSKFDQLINNNLNVVFRDCPPGEDTKTTPDLESVYSNQSNYFDSNYDFNNTDVDDDASRSQPHKQQTRHHSLMYYVYINTTNKLLSNVPFGSYLIKRRNISLPLNPFVRGGNEDANSSSAASSNAYKTPPLSTTGFEEAGGASNEDQHDEDDEDEHEPGEDEEQMERQVLQGLKLELFLDSLDSKTKVTLYNQLQSEYAQNTPKSSNVIEIKYNEDDIFLDKLQTFLLISVKIFITSLKLIIPISQYLYYKFKNNQIYLINNHNLISVFNKMLKCMNYIETKLNLNDELIDKIYNQEYLDKNMKYKSNNQQVLDHPLNINYQQRRESHGDDAVVSGGVPHEEQFDEIYQDLSLNLSKFVNDQIMENIINNERFNITNNKFDESMNLDSIWKKSVMDYLIARYLNTNQDNHKNNNPLINKKINPQQKFLRRDPNMAKYFSPRSSSPASTSGGVATTATTKPALGNSSSSPLVQSRGRERKPNSNLHPLSNSYSSSSSDENLNDMSVFGIAQQFANELN